MTKALNCIKDTPGVRFGKEKEGLERGAEDSFLMYAVFIVSVGERGFEFLEFLWLEEGTYEV